MLTKMLKYQLLFVLFSSFSCFVFGEESNVYNPICVATPDQRSIFVACIAPFLSQPYLNDVEEFVKCAKVPSLLHAIEILCLYEKDSPEVNLIQDCLRERDNLLDLPIEEEIAEKCLTQAVKYKDIDELIEDEGDK